MHPLLLTKALTAWNLACFEYISELVAISYYYYYVCSRNSPQATRGSKRLKKKNPPLPPTWPSNPLNPVEPVDGIWALVHVSGIDLED